jgi:hypothetical protein
LSLNSTSPASRSRTQTPLAPPAPSSAAESRERSAPTSSARVAARDEPGLATGVAAGRSGLHESACAQPISSQAVTTSATVRHLVLPGIGAESRGRGAVRVYRLE